MAEFAALGLVRKRWPATGRFPRDPPSIPASCMSGSRAAAPKARVPVDVPADVERAIPGSLIVAPSMDVARTLLESCGSLAAADFEDPAIGLAFDVAVAAIRGGDQPDAVSIRHSLEGRVPAAAMFVHQLMDGLPLLNLRGPVVASWARKVQARAYRRRAAADAAANAYEGSAEKSADFSRQAAGAPVLRLVSNVVRETVLWLWLYRIPLGKVTVLDGDPGLGKSTLTLDLAARVTTGRPMPGELGALPPGGVVLLSAEDAPADTLRPRLEEAGADLTRVAILTGVRAPKGHARPLSLPGDLSAIREAISTMAARLVVIDPLMAFLSSSVDSHRDQDVRGTLALISDLAAQTGAAVLLVRHLNKGGSGNPLYRGGGSIGIIGAARSGLLVAADPKDPARRVLAATKSNLSPMATSLAFRLVPRGDVAGVSWEGAAELSASDLVAGETRDQQGAVATAADFLRELLADGPVSTVAARAQAEEAGISWRSVERARSEAGVRCYRRGGLGQEGRWYMELRHQEPHGGHGGESTHGGLSQMSGDLGTFEQPQGAAGPYVRQSSGSGGEGTER